MVSSVGAETPPDGDDVFSVYLRAKAEADRALADSDRDWTIARPGSLTDEPGTGRVRLDTEPFRGKVSRDDVAAVLAAVLHEPASAGAHPLRERGGEPHGAGPGGGPIQLRPSLICSQRGPNAPSPSL